jgi:hypothetical protein
VNPNRYRDGMRSAIARLSDAIRELEQISAEMRETTLHERTLAIQYARTIHAVLGLVAEDLEGYE